MPGQDFPRDWPHPSNFFWSAPSFFRAGATAMQGCCSRASGCRLPCGFWQHPQGAHAWLQLLLVRNLCQQLARCCHVPPAAAPFQNNTCPCSEQWEETFLFSAHFLNPWHSCLLYCSCFIQASLFPLCTPVNAAAQYLALC